MGNGNCDHYWLTRRGGTCRACGDMWTPQPISGPAAYLGSALASQTVTPKENPLGTLVYVECGCGRRFRPAQLPTQCCGKRLADTGPCWSCDAANSPQYDCDFGHAWFCCEETCGQKTYASKQPWDKGRQCVAWEDCPECQALMHDEEKKREDNRDFDMDDAGESGERSYSGWMSRGGK